MKRIVISCLGVVVFLNSQLTSLSQENSGRENSANGEAGLNVDVPSIQDEQEAEFSGDETPEDGGENEDGSGTAELNESEALRLQRLAEASGKTEQEILDLRNGASLEGEPATVQKRGWGQVAKMLGLHPGVLGHGTGDKFYPPVENENNEGDGGLPELPSLEGAADKAAASARQKSGKRRSLGGKEGFGPEDSQTDRRQMRRLKREAGDRKVRSGGKGRPDKPGQSGNKKGEARRPKK